MPRQRVVFERAVLAVSEQAAVADALVLGEIAIKPTDASLVILEPTLASWGVRGGHSAADVDVGFPIDL
jgi:hypothetical protein